MPKAKPTQVIVHRIELQETERAAMEAALAGNFVTNAVGAAGSVFTGIGNLLAPFSGALTAIAGLWIAEKGAEAVIETVEEGIEGGKKVIDWVNPKKQGDAYQYICAFLMACSGWDGDENSVVKKGGQLVKDLKGPVKANPLLILKFQQFMKVVTMEKHVNGTWPPKPPAMAWKNFYGPSQYLADVKSTIPGF